MSNWLGPGVPRYLVKYYPGFVCVRVFLDEITTKSVDWTKQIVCPNVGSPIQLVWRPKENKKADIPTSKWKHLLPDCLQAEALVFSGFWAEDIGLFRLELKHRLFLDIRPSDSYWNHTVGPPGSPACWLQILGRLSLHNHVSHFLITLFICKCTLFLLFLWGTLTNPVWMSCIFIC